MKAGRALFVALVVSAAPPALAHGTEPGLRGAYEAFIHTVADPPAPLLLFALGIAIGLKSAHSIKWSTFAYVAGLLTGLATTLSIGMLVHPELPMLMIAIASALTVSLAAHVPLRVMLCACAVSGYVMGVASAPAPAAGSTQAFASVGAIAGASLGLATVALAIRAFNQEWNAEWAAIGLRIATSWIAAIAVLCLSLLLRP